jgi:hypothetical protein
MGTERVGKREGVVVEEEEEGAAVVVFEEEEEFVFAFCEL